MLPAPRAPLTYQTKSGRTDQPDRYAESMLKFSGDLREAAINELRLDQEYPVMQKYIQALQGDQWGRNRPRYRSQFVDNVLSKARVESKAYLTDVRPTIDIRSKAEAFSKQAAIIKNVLHSEWRSKHMDLTLASLIDFANFGKAYARVGATMPGDLYFRAYGMDCVMAIQHGETFQESSAVLYRVHKPVQYFYKMFRERAKGIERYADAAMNAMSTNQYNRPGHVDEYTWNTMSAAMKYKLGVRIGRPAPSESEPFPTVALEEFWIDDPAVNETKERILIRNPYSPLEEHNYWYWVNPGQPLWPRKRLVIFGGERKLLYDGPSPYWHGEYPFGELILDPIVWGPGGFSRYRPLVPIQAGINETNAGVFDLVKKALNQSLIGKKGSVADAAFDRYFQDQPGSKIMMTPTANPQTDLKYGPVPELPGWTPLFLKHLYERFDRQAGGFDSIMQLRGKKQLPSSDAIQNIKDSQSGQFRLEGRYIEMFLTSIGPQAVSNIIQFFTLGQRMRLLGKDGITPFDFDFRPGDLAPFGIPREDHWKSFAVEILPGSLHGASEEAEQMKFVNLFRMGALSLKALHRKLNIGETDSQQIFAELAEQAQAGVTPGSRPRPARSSGQKGGKAQ